MAFDRRLLSLSESGSGIALQSDLLVSPCCQTEYTDSTTFVQFGTLDIVHGQTRWYFVLKSAATE